MDILRTMMFNPLNVYTQRLHAALDAQGVVIPVNGVKIYNKGESLPEVAAEAVTDHLTVTSCQAVRQAALGDAITLTLDNIGCVAAAITFGLVDENSTSPLGGSRIYTDLMAGKTEQGTLYKAPAPKDFTAGRVYACQEEDNRKFCLFGAEDSGRFQSIDVARRAISGMSALQPADTQAVFFYPADSEEPLPEPDVVVLSVRPVEMTRLIQGYQYLTGERIIANMGPLRAVNSDLIVRPLKEQCINISPYCLGARLIGQFEADRMGMGMPWEHYKLMVEGLEASRTGYPFKEYPGALEPPF